jgi:hypothetical protein
MEINAEKFIATMHKNFGYPIVKTKLGKGIKVDNMTAFIYSSVTGAGYLDNPLYPFTIKGLTKLFYNAFDYKFVTGLFDNTTIKNTPYLLSKAKSFLFDSDKIIIPVEFKSELELQKKLKEFIEEVGNKSTDYLIQRIEISKNGNGMEPFMEYLTCEVMKNKNYIVENQIPLTHSTGSPDFGGYKFKIDSTKGFSNMHIIELALLRLGIELSKLNVDKENLIVGEAKTSTTSMKAQLKKYMKTGLFNEGFEIHPNKSTPSENSYGIVYIDEDASIKVKESSETHNYLDENQQNKYIIWLNDYIKFYLIANLTNDEFMSLYKKRTGKEISNRKDVINFVISLSIDEIFKIITGVMKNGSIK